jgi:hypothetical protein
MMTFALLGALGCAACLVVLSWYERFAVPPEWEMILSAEGQRAYRQLRERLWAEQQALDWSCDRAAGAKTRAEALVLLSASCEFLASLTPSRVDLLRKLTLLSRAASAIAPMPAVKPGRFKLPEVRGIVGLGAVLHYLFVTTSERFQLRLFVLKQGFAAVLRALFRSQRQIEHASSAQLAWLRILAAREDFKALDQEALESWRVLMLAIGELRIAEAVAR